MIDILYPLVRKCLFQLDPESAHHLSMQGLRLAERSGLLGLMTPSKLQGEAVEVMGLRFPNRIGLAAGLDKEGNTIDALGRLGFGHIEIGTITPKAQPGNPCPRLFRLVDHEAVINRMGFNNSGIDQGILNVLSSHRYQGIVGFNIGKNKMTPNEQAADDYLSCFRKAYPVADYIVINLSSPNTPGLRDLQGAEQSARLLGLLKQEQAKLQLQYGREVPLVFKVAPDLDDGQIRELSRVFLDGGLDGLIATNTTLDRAGVDAHHHAGEAGGLSGVPLMIKSTEVLRAFSSHLSGKIPIIGVGGISTLDDAREKLKAGASLVKIYSSLIYRGPRLVREIARGLTEASIK